MCGFRKKLSKGAIKGVPRNNGVCHGGPMLLFGNLTMWVQGVCIIPPPPSNPHMINVIIWSTCIFLLAKLNWRLSELDSSQSQLSTL